jgi:hypothetical protein
MSPTMELLTGRTLGTVKIGNISLSGNNRRYSVHCIRPGCNSSWTEAHEFIMTRLNAGLSLQCRNVNCYLNHIQPPKEGIQPPEPTLLQQPSIQAQTQRPAPQPRPAPSPDAYRAYFNHAVLFDWTQIVSRATFEGLSQRGRDFIQRGVNADLIRKELQDAPGTRGDR